MTSVQIRTSSPKHRLDEPSSLCKSPMPSSPCTLFGSRRDLRRFRRSLRRHPLQKWDETILVLVAADRNSKNVVGAAQACIERPCFSRLASLPAGYECCGERVRQPCPSLRRLQGCCLEYEVNPPSSHPRGTAMIVPVTVDILFPSPSSVFYRYSEN